MTLDCDDVEAVSESDTSFALAAVTVSGTCAAVAKARREFPEAMLAVRTVI